MSSNWRVDFTTPGWTPPVYHQCNTGCTYGEDHGQCAGGCVIRDLEGSIRA